MPANKNAMTRYKILDDLLSNRYHNYSLDDLTEEVNLRLSEMYPDTNGVVRRTIEKDIFYLDMKARSWLTLNGTRSMHTVKKNRKPMPNNASDIQVRRFRFSRNRCL